MTTKYGSHAVAVASVCWLLWSDCPEIMVLGRQGRQNPHSRVLTQAQRAGRSSGRAAMGPPRRLDAPRHLEMRRPFSAPWLVQHLSPSSRACGRANLVRSPVGTSSGPIPGHLKREVSEWLGVGGDQPAGRALGSSRVDHRPGYIRAIPDRQPSMYSYFARSICTDYV